MQKSALRIIYKEGDKSYQHALTLSKLPTLEDRRAQLCLKFALKCVSNPKTTHMFPINPPKVTRENEKFTIIHANTERLKRSAIPSMARQLNQYYRTRK